MEPLYHLTEERYLTEILKNGLIPQLGDKCKLIEDEREGVFLCGYDQIPYWQILLNRSVILQINDIDKYSLEEFLYSGNNKEYLSEQIIPPEKIKIFSLSASDFRTKEVMIELCTDYIYQISSLCVKCARYYNMPQLMNFEKEFCIKDIIYNALKITAVLPNLDYTIDDMSRWVNLLKLIGEEGHYTFCDNYGNTENKLWQQLIDYPSDASEKVRREIYNFIQYTFPFAETLDTGGFEIPKIFN